MARDPVLTFTDKGIYCAAGDFYIDPWQPVARALMGKRVGDAVTVLPYDPLRDRVLLVEDLTTDGGSKLSFVDAIRETGATCGHTAVIFYYGIFPETEKTLGDHGVALHHLCTWWDVLAEARAQGSFDAETLAEVEAFLNDPRKWQSENAK